MRRKTANRTISDILIQLIEDNPDMRFGQILANFGFVEDTPMDYSDPSGFKQADWKNEFSLESSTLLSRVEDNVRRRYGIIYGQKESNKKDQE